MATATAPTGALEDPSESTEVERLVALRRGDESAFRQLIADLTPGLTRVARSYVTPAQADDVVQDTWMAVIRSLDRFEGRSTLKTWIFRILFNKVRTLAGREARVVPFTSLARDSGDFDADAFDDPFLGPGYWSAPPHAFQDFPGEALEGAEVLAMIGAAIEVLPPMQRRVFELRDVIGVDSAEVSELLGISRVNQRVVLHRARSAIRAMLEEYFRDGR